MSHKTMSMTAHKSVAKEYRNTKNNKFRVKVLHFVTQKLEIIFLHHV